MRNTACATLKIVLLFACSHSGEAQVPNQGVQKKAWSEEDIAAASYVSPEARDLAKKAAEKAMGLIQSGSVGNFKALGDLLVDPDFLAALGGADRGPSLPVSSTSVFQVLHAAAKAPADRAEPMLLKLGQSKAFMSSSLRGESLVLACGEVANPSNKLLDFLDDLVKSRSISSRTALELFCKMHSVEASKRILPWFYMDPKTDRDFEVTRARMVFGLMSFREDPLILGIFKALVSDGDAGFRNLAVYLLFEEQPNRNAFEKVDLLKARLEWSDDALRKLDEIGELSLKQVVSEDNRAVVVKARKDAKQILEFRSAGGPKRIATLIANLDENSYAIRQKATLELIKYGRYAQLPLQEALAHPPSLEARRRIEQVLATIAEQLKENAGK